MQTQEATTATTTKSYYAHLCEQETQHIRDTVRITYSNDLKARDQEIYGRMRQIHELEEGDPTVISDFCQKVINAEADVHVILDALPALKAKMLSRGYDAHNRILIRDAFKQVLFHRSLEHAATQQLYEAIHAISRM